jgi:riboflavin transporter FmnP
MSKTYRLVATATLASLAFSFQFANSVLGLQTGFGMTIDLVAVPIIIALFVFGVESAIEVLAVSTIFIALFAQTGPIGAAMKFAATAPTLIVFGAYMITRRDGASTPTLVLAALASIVFTVALFAAGGLMQRVFGSEGGLLFGLMPIAAMLLITYLVLRHFERERIANAALHKPSAFSNARIVALLALSVIVIRGASMIVSNFFFAGPLYFKLSPDQFIAFINSADLLFFGKGTAWYVAIFAFNAIQAALEIALAYLVAYQFGFAKKYSS